MAKQKVYADAARAHGSLPPTVTGAADVVITDPAVVHIDRRAGIAALVDGGSSVTADEARAKIEADDTGALA